MYIYIKKLQKNKSKFKLNTNNIIYYSFSNIFMLLYYPDWIPKFPV